MAESVGLVQTIPVIPTVATMKFAVILFVVCVICSAAAEAPKTPAHHIAKHVSTDVAVHAHSKVAEVGEQKHVEQKHDAQEHDDHKHAKKVGKALKHRKETAHKGHRAKVSHKVHDHEKAAVKSAGHHEAAHQSHKKAAAHEEHGAKDTKSFKHKNSGITKGFEEKYRKNEHKKHDSFYDVSKKSGESKAFAAKNSKHASGEDLQQISKKNKVTTRSVKKSKKSSKKANKKSGERKAQKAPKKHAGSHQKKAKAPKPVQ